MVNTNLDDSALRLSRESGTPLSTTRANTSGLAMDDDEEYGDEEYGNKTKNKTNKRDLPPRKRRRRKRRKVVIDNHETELTNDHIRMMLRDTEDLVAAMIHPASLWEEDGSSSGREEPKTYRVLVLEERAKQQAQNGTTTSTSTSTAANKKSSKKSNHPVLSLTRPFLQDGDSNGNYLHPNLASLWKDNYWKALGDPCPYSKLTPADDVEELRRNNNNDDHNPIDESDGETSDLEAVASRDNKQHNPQQQEENDFEFPTAVDDDDEEEEEDTDVPVPDFGDETEEGLASLKQRNSSSSIEGLDLGMVNDMVLDSDQDEYDQQNSDDEDQNRQAIGELASSSTKWHKHTVRVYNHLKKCIRHDNNDDDSATSDTHNKSKDSVDFSELTKHVVSRRNASSIFFEMLQLKTWDFIEVDQDEAYGRIAISAGQRFGEDAPNN